MLDSVNLVTGLAPTGVEAGGSGLAVQSQDHFALSYHNDRQRHTF